MNIVHVSPNAQEIESWIALIDNQVVGHIFMKLEKDNKVKFLDAWVHDEHRRKGIYRKLWDTRWEYVKEHYKGYTVYAWCKNSSLPLLLEKGFKKGEIATYVEQIIPETE
jgi:ribosomal protein S18 acetylase RimI-like enzyme